MDCRTHTLTFCSSCATIKAAAKVLTANCVLVGWQVPTDIHLAQETVMNLASTLVFQAAKSPPPAFPAFVAIPLTDPAKMTPEGGAAAGSASAGSASDASTSPPPITETPAPFFMGL